MGITVKSTEWLLLHCFQIELEFGNVGFCGERKTVIPGENSRNRDENQKQTQPTYDAEIGNRTRAASTLVGGECSHHCAIPAPKWFYCESSKISILWEFVSLLNFLRFT